MIFLKTLLALATLVLLGRQIFLLLSSEIGRKLDLTKRRYKNHPQFNFALLIPIATKEDWQAFASLLSALAQQSYPLELIQIHLLVPEPLKDKLQRAITSPIETTFWGFPKQMLKADNAFAELLNWGVERLLALGGQPKQIVALKPDDLVKPDFIEQLAYKAALYPAVQSYMALKQKPNNWLAMVSALNQRLFNRISQAGRSHLGLSAKLQPSGWMIHQDVLEKVPLFFALNTYPMGYQLLLNRAGYNIHWATSVMIYQSQLIGLKAALDEVKLQLISRIHYIVEGLSAIASPQLLFKNPIVWLDHVWQWIKPPEKLIGFGLLAIWLISIGFNLSTASFMQFVFLAYVSLKIISLLVARFSGLDILFYVFASPMATLVTMVTLPAYLVFTLLKQFFEPQQQTSNNKKSVALDSLSISETDNQFSDEKDLSDTLEEKDHALLVQENALQELVEALPSNPENLLLSAPIPNHFKQPHEMVISNGSQRITCQVTLSALVENNNYRYQMVLHYKGATFETQFYPIVDQAFYELQSKLQDRGFYVFSCGSCAFFYHPPTGSFQQSQEEADMEADGFCLQAKQGVSLEQNTSRIHVLSPYCHYHRDHAFRDDILKQWKESLAQNLVR